MAHSDPQSTAEVINFNLEAVERLERHIENRKAEFVARSQRDTPAENKACDIIYKEVESLEREVARLREQLPNQIINGNGYVRRRRDYDDPPDGRPRPKPHVNATPHVWRDPKTIPPRDFIYGDHIIRGFVSGDISMGGTGKTSEAMVEVAAMVTGRDLLGVKPKRQYRVWYIDLEDPLNEIERRFAAVFKKYNIIEEHLGNRLFKDSGRDRRFVIAHDGRNGIEFDEEVLAMIAAPLKRMRSMSSSLIRS